MNPSNKNIQGGGLQHGGDSGEALLVLPGSTISKSDCHGLEEKGFTSWWRKIVLVLEGNGLQKMV